MPKKNSALVHGMSVPISTKVSMDICSMIRGKTIDTALRMLEEVSTLRRVVKMNKREMPHQHGKGVMAGRYPQTAAKEFIRLVKQLKSNAIANGLEIEKHGLFCKADYASRPYRRGGSQFKRTHITLMIENKQKKNSKK